MVVVVFLFGVVLIIDDRRIIMVGYQSDRVSILMVFSVYQDDNLFVKVVNIVRMVKKFMVKFKVKGQRVYVII